MRPRARRLGAGLAIAGLLLAGAAWWGFPFAKPDPNRPARVAYEDGDWRDALNHARKRLTAAPDDREALRLLARASARLGRDAETETLYRRLGVEGAEAEDFLLLGQALLRSGQQTPGLRMLERARDAAPDRADVLRALADEYERLGLTLASEQVARALVERPGATAIDRWRHAERLRDLDRPAEAAATFESLLRQEPGGEDPVPTPRDVRIQAARAWLRVTEPVRVRSVLEPLLAGTADAEAAWLLSRACLQQDDRAGAAAALAKAGDFGRDDPTRPEPAGWVGSRSCKDCHAAIHRAQRASRHAHTLAFGAGLDRRSVPDGPVRDPGNRAIEHRVERSGPGTVRAKLAAADDRFEAVFAYAIGSGNRGWTPIVRDDSGRSWEYRLTRYADPVGWDVTIHHPAVAEAGGELGKPLMEDQVRDCLGCHSTNPDAVREARPVEASTDAQGIDCERCHGPAGNHLLAAKLGFPDPAIARPKRATGPQRDALCAGCHRAPRGFPDDVPDFVRFQSPTLARSRCYLESGGAMECITCHNPHRDAATEPATYEGLCRNCHDPRTPKRPVAAHPCPVDADKGCVGCHMPRVPNVIPHTAYTDHFIRVHREAAVGGR